MITDRVLSREVRKWGEITADPLWYKALGKEELAFADFSHPKLLPRIGATAISPLKPEIKGKQATKKAPHHLLYLIFEELLETEQVQLGTSKNSYNWDSERQKVDKIIIHHSKSPEPMRSHYLSAMELLRLYAPVYKNPDQTDRNRGITGQPIYSGHYDNVNRQGFWIYHWLVGPDGRTVRYLNDEQTGWQAGDWNVNCQSVAICIDDDVSNRSPSSTELDGVAEVIRSNYSHLDIGPHTVLGHNEVRPRPTNCPGSEFLPLWKGQLLQMLQA